MAGRRAEVAAREETMNPLPELRERLAFGALEDHPDDAAGVLERLPTAAAAELFASAESEHLARVLGRIDPAAGSAIVAALSEDRAGSLLEALSLESAAPLIRRLDPVRAEALLARQPPRRGRALRALVRFRDGTAGALMDPEVLALPVDVAADEALQRLRESPERARYNVYVVDRGQKLLGVLNLHELLQAAPRATLASLMNRDPHRVLADADRRAIVQHPGWREVTALPVVDAAGNYLGAIRYRTLRRIESELAPGGPDGGSAANALGDLFATATAGMLEAALGAPSRDAGGGSNVG
ncbi:MAG: CBS domain-containing protein [Myxococcota bacterium]